METALIALQVTKAMRAQMIYTHLGLKHYSIKQHDFGYSSNLPDKMNESLLWWAEFSLFLKMLNWVVQTYHQEPNYLSSLSVLSPLQLSFFEYQ